VFIASFWNKCVAWRNFYCLYILNCSTKSYYLYVKPVFGNVFFLLYKRFPN
jgi:hypothetical protein